MPHPDQRTGVSSNLQGGPHIVSDIETGHIVAEVAVNLSAWFRFRNVATRTTRACRSWLRGFDPVFRALFSMILHKEQCVKHVGGLRSHCSQRIRYHAVSIASFFMYI